MQHQPADSVEHVPPRSFFRHPTPHLITLPSCTRCNRGSHLDDDYLLAFLVSLDVPGTRRHSTACGSASLADCTDRRPRLCRHRRRRGRRPVRRRLNPAVHIFAKVDTRRCAFDRGHRPRGVARPLPVSPWNMTVVGPLIRRAELLQDQARMRRAAVRHSSQPSLAPDGFGVQ